jgi:hypothetical protein
LNSITGWKPRFSFEQGLLRTKEHLQLLEKK